MKFLPLIWANLWRKPLRTLLTLGALIAAFAVLGLVKGVDAQLDNMMALGKMNKMWVDSRFGRPMPSAYKDQIAKLPGVTYVTGQSFVFGYIREPKNPAFAGGTEDNIFEFFPHFAPSPAKLKEWMDTPNGLVITKPTADRIGLKEGDDIAIHSDPAPTKTGSKDWMFHVVAIIDRPDIPLSNFSGTHYHYLDELRPTNNGTIDQFLVMVDDPDKGFETAKAIDALFENSATPTRTQLDYVRMASRATSFGDVKFFVNAVAGVTLAALLLLTSNVMLQSYRERMPEFGVLKTLGFGDGALLVMVFAESLIQFVAGAAIGLAFARFASGIIRETPGFFLAPIFAVSWGVYAVGLGLGVMLSFINAALPAWRTRRLQIVDALVVK